MLVGARVQGVGGGLLIRVAMAMIFELFEPAEARAGAAVFEDSGDGRACDRAGARRPGAWDRWVGAALPDQRASRLMPVAMSLLREHGPTAKGAPSTSPGCVRPVPGPPCSMGAAAGRRMGMSLRLRRSRSSPAERSCWSAFTLHSLHHDTPSSRSLATPVFAVSIGALCLMTVAGSSTPTRFQKHEGHQRAAHGLVMMPAAARRGRGGPAGGSPTAFTSSGTRSGRRSWPCRTGVAGLTAEYQSGVDLPRPPVRWLRRRHRVNVAGRDELGQSLRRPGVGTQLGHPAGGGGVRHHRLRVDLRIDGSRHGPISADQAWSATPSMPSTPCSSRGRRRP